MGVHAYPVAEMETICSEFAPCSEDASVYLFFVVAYFPLPPPGVSRETVLVRERNPS